MPETLYTNSPREVRAFIRGKGGHVVYKPFMATAWQDSTQCWMPYTAVLHDEALACGLPLLDAFSSFLSQAEADFDWCADSVQVRYSDPAFEEAMRIKSAEFSRAHAATPPRVVYEDEGYWPPTSAPQGGHKGRAGRKSARR